MKKHNFSAGPSILPEIAYQNAAKAILDFNGTGLSILSISHRTKDFEAVLDSAQALMRELLNIPENYHIYFVGGGASTQFFHIPANFLGKKAGYVDTGVWTKKAIKEAKLYGDVEVVASSADKTYSYIPKTTAADFDPDADYVHICMNNTIYGTKYAELPDTGDVPLIADISSCILSEPIDVSKFGMLYAGAQKNVAPAGVTIVIIRKDLIGNAMDITPTMLKYKTQADNDSLYNTPPCYGIYICGKVFKWIKKMGGLEAMKAINEKKAAILYDFLDNSKMFKGTVVPEDRSLMNVPFVTDSEELNAKFIKEAKEAGFVNLKGHRTVGGMRASIYNAMPIEGVEKLVEFMKKFEEANS